MMTAAIRNDRLVYYRLITLWVICETLLGGIIHSFHIPFSSIVLSGSAVICICLMAKVTDKAGIIRATVIVVIFKFLLSPQSPPAAYLAVFVQGISGAFIFTYINNYKGGCILLGLFALAESAFQRIIILLVLFGNDFPKAINKFVQAAFGKNVNVNYSLYLAVIYILIHIVLGALVGYFAFSLTRKKITKDESIYLQLTQEETQLQPYKKKRKFKIWLLLTWIILIVLLIHSWIYPQYTFLSARSVLVMLVRSVIILLTWYLFLSPILIYYFKRWVGNKKQLMNSDIQEVILLLPSTKYLIKQSWVLSSRQKGLYRILLCCRIIAYNILLPN